MDVPRTYRRTHILFCFRTLLLMICVMFLLPLNIYAASPKTIVLKPKSTHQLTIKNVKKSKAAYKSRTPAIAAVSKNGKITALRKGTTTVTAKYRGKAYKYKIKVIDPKLNKKFVTVATGHSVKLKLNGTLKKGKVTWRSSNPSTASVTSKGLIKGKKAGTATITAKYRGWKFKCRVVIQKTSKPSKQPVTLTPEAQTRQKDDNDMTKKILALKTTYPEGKSWTNNDYYDWKGGWVAGGYGCAGFAFKISDMFFTKKVTVVTRQANETTNSIPLSKIRPGDILMYTKKVHSVVVVKNNGSSLTIVEGNYNKSIHWGRTLSSKEVKNEIFYWLTRW